jgi:hypothetical protein
MNTRYSLTLFSLIHIICDTYCHNLLNKCFRSSIFFNNYVFFCLFVLFDKYRWSTITDIFKADLSTGYNTKPINTIRVAHSFALTLSKCIFKGHKNLKKSSKFNVTKIPKNWPIT